MQVRVSSAATLASFNVVSLQPLCVIACISICPHVKNPQHWQPYHCLDAWKYCTHQQEWVALLLWLLCLTQVWWLEEFPARDHEVLKEWGARLGIKFQKHGWLFSVKGKWKVWVAFFRQLSHKGLKQEWLLVISNKIQTLKFFVLSVFFGTLYIIYMFGSCHREGLNLQKNVCISHIIFWPTLDALQHHYQAMCQYNEYDNATSWVTPQTVIEGQGCRTVKCV